ncbi:hypothetical protein AK966_04145 [Vibrio sp. PID23_8]|nr:hypothetical protein AK966_04145 [Vibrio sp. PID23_8]
MNGCLRGDFFFPAINPSIGKSCIQIGVKNGADSFLSINALRANNKKAARSNLRCLFSIRLYYSPTIDIGEQKFLIDLIADMFIVSSALL